MKAIFTLLLFCFFSVLHAQHLDYSSLQGLRDNKANEYFEISGYDISIKTWKGQIDNPKTIASIQKKYKLKNITAQYSDSQIKVNNLLIEAETELENQDRTKANLLCYLLPKSAKEVYVILLQTCNQRDIFLEQEFVNAWLDNSLNSYISDSWIAESVPFAGRILQLGNACGWRRPHHISYGGGQISWSEFSSFESAEFDLNSRIQVNKSNHAIILQEEDIDVVFEDIPTVAHRVVYTSKNRYSYYPLIVYYIAEEVRGKYISCVMSHYGYSRNDYELSPLLKEVIHIPQLPESAYNPFDIPEPEPITDEQKEAMKDLINVWEVRLGAGLNTGNLRNLFTAAPAFGIYVGFPFKHNMTIDIGMNFTIPIRPNLFDYYYKNEIHNIKPTSVIAVNLRYRYQHKLANNLYCSPYAGMGVSVIQTNLLKQVDGDGNKTYHELPAFDLLGGVNLKYKRVGCFIEYHNASYYKTRKVKENFGSSSVNIGIAAFF